MAFESSGTILYVANISYQSHKWYGNCQWVPKLYTDTHIDKHKHTQTDTHTHTDTRQTDRQTLTEAHFISLVFLRKSRNKTKTLLQASEILRIQKHDPLHIYILVCGFGYRPPLTGIANAKSSGEQAMFPKNIPIDTIFSATFDLISNVFHQLSHV